MHEPTPSPGRQHLPEPAPPAAQPPPAQAAPGAPAEPAGGLPADPGAVTGEDGGYLPVDEPADFGAGGPRPLEVGTSPTGHAGVDEVLERLADADHLDVSDHLRVYEDVHGGLRDTLAALDQRPGPPPPTPGPAPGRPAPTPYESNRS